MSTGTSMTHDPSQSPWYKQIWAWFVIAILAFAVFIGIGLLLVTDRILDMMRTAVNVFSDSCAAVVIARSEGEQTLIAIDERKLVK